MLSLMVVMDSCAMTFFSMSVSQKATPPVEAETAAKGNPLSSSVEVLVDSAPVIKDRKVGMLCHQSINFSVFRGFTVDQALYNNKQEKKLLQIVFSYDISNTSFVF